MYESYTDIFKDINGGERIFACLSIVGCKDVVTEHDDYGFGYRGEIDRDVVACPPVVCERLVDKDNVEISIKKLYIEFLTSIGVSNNNELNELIKEIYDA